LDAGEETALYYFKRRRPGLQSFAFQLGGYYWTDPVELAKLWDPKVQRPFVHPIEFTDTNNGTLNLFAEVKYALFASWMKVFVLN